MSRNNLIVRTKFDASFTSSFVANVLLRNRHRSTMAPQRLLFFSTTAYHETCLRRGTTSCRQNCYNLQERHAIIFGQGKVRPPGRYPLKRTLFDSWMPSDIRVDIDDNNCKNYLVVQKDFDAGSIILLPEGPVSTASNFVEPRKSNIPTLGVIVAPD